MEPAPTENDTGTIPPASTEIEASTILPTSIKRGACIIVPTGQEAHTSQVMPTDHTHQGIPGTDWPASRNSERSSTDDNTKDEEYVSCVIAWLGLNPDCKRMGDAKTMILPHQERKVGSNDVLIVRHAVKEYP